MPSPESIKSTHPIYSFIAYAAEAEAARDPRPEGGDQPLTIRVQTFVRYAPAIRIKAINPNSDGSGVIVTFDGTSVGYKNDLTAHLVRTDPGVKLAEKALNENRPVSVGIEAHRKAKAGGTELPRIVPIHVLRGANEKGRGGNTNTTSTNIGANVIAYIDGHRTVECASNTDEWAELCESNSTGLIAPAGWRVITSPEWGEYSFITQDAASRNAGGVDAEALSDVIEKIVYDTLVRYHDENSNGTAHTINGIPTEGTPWNVRTSDGRMSLGNYSQGRYVDLLSWWTRTLRRNPVWSQRGTGPIQPLAQMYAFRTFQLLNQVVERAYACDGMAPWPVDPAKEGWRTAWRHLSYLLSDALAAAAEDGAETADVMVFADHDGNDTPDEEAWREWANFWGVSATESLRHATAVLDDFYGEEWQERRNNAKRETARRKNEEKKSQRAQKPQNEAAKANEAPKAQEQQQSAAPAPQTAAPSSDESIRQSLYQAVKRAWNDSDGLQRIIGQLAEKQMADLAVTVNTNEGDLLAITDAQPGQPSGPITQLLQWRVGKIAEQQQASKPQQSTGGNTLGVAVEEEDRVSRIHKEIAAATSSDELDDLEAVLNAENLADAEVTIGEFPSSLGILLRHRRKQMMATAG